MCGLLGVYSPHGASRSRVLNAMDKLRHRGPDAVGIWHSKDNRLLLGHARLKIIDLSDSANQPLISPDGRWVLIYNGEIVNFAEVRRAFAGRWNFRTESDSEVLLATFSLTGLEAMQDWVGMFAFAMFDQQSNKLYLVRDRFGIKPLYWVSTYDGGFAFASEIPPLLPFVKSTQADNDIIRTYLETGIYESGDRTFFKDVRSLEPGSVAIIDLQSQKWDMRRWYRLEDRTQDLSGADEEELISLGVGLIEAAVRDHLVADVQVGVNVSGGVDSSVLLSQAMRHLGHVHAFSQVYEEPYSELQWVKEVSADADLHLSRLDSEQVLALLPDVVRQQAEPFGGVTVCGFDPLYREADRAGVTVLLDGNGIDEAFLGYKKYHSAFVHSQNDEDASGAAKDEYRSFWQEDPLHISSTELGKSIDGSAELCSEAIAEELRRHSFVIPPSPSVSRFEDPIKEMAARDLLATKIPRGLRFNDRMSMVRSKELRVPFLDHRLVEFAFSVPTRHLLNRNGSKALFRAMASRMIGASIAYATKRSVQSPQREWLADQWRSLVLDIIESRSFASRGWISPARARKVYERYCEGARANSFFIWQWINLELWAREFLD